MRLAHALILALFVSLTPMYNRSSAEQLLNVDSIDGVLTNKNIPVYGSIKHDYYAVCVFSETLRFSLIPDLDINNVASDKRFIRKKANGSDRILYRLEKRHITIEIVKRSFQYVITSIIIEKNEIPPQMRSLGFFVDIFQMNESITSGDIRLGCEQNIVDIYIDNGYVYKIIIQDLRLSI